MRQASAASTANDTNHKHTGIMNNQASMQPSKQAGTRKTKNIQKRDTQQTHISLKAPECLPHKPGVLVPILCLHVHRFRLI